MNDTQSVFIRDNSMALQEELEQSGNWLFKHRSNLPLLMIGVIVMCMRNFHYLGQSETIDEYWEALCFFISFIGLGIRAFTIGHTPKGTSGRNTKEQIAETLNKSGIYSVVRHPLYLGNYFIWLGISLFPHQWELTIICILVFWIYYERIMFAEEAFLRRKFGKNYEDWASETPAFIPNFKLWKRPDLEFSIKNVLKREYNGLFVIIISMAALELTGNLFVHGRLEFGLLWRIILVLGFIVWAALRILKKKTLLLNVDGR